jgi:hypothetical protein
VPFWTFCLVLAATYGYLLLVLFSIDQKVDLFQERFKTFMSAFSDFVTAMQGFQDRQTAALAGVAADVKGLKDQVAALIAAGTLSPADLAAAQGIEAKAQGIADGLEALDAETPPVAPTANGAVAG